MILQYHKLEDERLEQYKDPKILYFKPDDFKDYRKELEEEGRTVTVIRNTKFKELDEDDDDVKDEEYLEIKGKKYKLLDENEKHTRGYFYVGDDKFIRIQGNLFFLIPLFSGLAALLAILIIIFCIRGCGNDEISVGGEPGNDLEFEDVNKWDGTQQQNGDNTTAAQESTIIPGFAKITATEGASTIQLYNPTENTVYFVYTITELETKDEIGTYATVDEAQKEATAQSPTYTNYYDEATGKYMLEDGDGNKTDKMVECKVSEKDGKYVVTKSVSRVIYFTKAIAPDNSVDWDIKESLEPGTYNLQFRISPYDVETQSLCYGAISDVLVIVK